MDEKMLKWAPVVCGFFAFGGLFAVVSYHVLNTSAGMPLWQTVVRWTLLLVVTVIFGLYGLLMQGPERGRFWTGILFGSVVGFIVSTMLPSYEYASNYALASMSIGIIYVMVGGGIFTSKLRKNK